eukprot:TRINITY_DN2866_c0_g1_i1.p1 TRINITY_DN2866_c0_g1~~TRINITY_DN2866_c0_g1_i1.p1  ORF type:complete len:265 (-),score=19.39 TRINITY_DN2866_c0_g1_i1:16-810(-)
MSRTWNDVAAVFSGSKSPTDDFTLDTIRLADIRSDGPFKVLDVGCGGGTLAVLVAQQHPNATVVACDSGQAMVGATNARISAARLANITAEVQDGTALAYPPAHFRYVFCQFVAMFYADPGKGFAELHRVLEAGGTCAVATWREAELVRLMEDALLAVAPGTVVRHDVSPHPLVFKEESALRERARAAGFREAEVVAVSHEMCMSREMVQSMIRQNPGLAHLLAGLSEEQMGRYEQEVWERVKPNTTEEGIKFKMVANVLIAKK